MSRRRMAGLLAVAAALAFVAAACGGDGDSGEQAGPPAATPSPPAPAPAPPAEPPAPAEAPPAEEPPAPPAEPAEPPAPAEPPEEGPQAALAVAAQKTVEAGSSKLTFTVEQSIPGIDQPVTLSGEGEFDYANRRGTLTFDASSMLGAIGGGDTGDPDAGKIDVIFDGNVFYMQFPLLTALLPDAKPWLKLDLETLGAQSGIDLGQLSQLQQSDPSQALAYLRAASGELAEVGEEDVQGVSTTRYRGTIDLDKVASRAPPEAQAQLEQAMQALEQQTGLQEIPFEAWVDRDGLVRRMTYEYSINVPGADGETQSSASKVTTEFSDFGIDVSVEPPPPDQVTDFAELASLGASGGTDVATGGAGE